MTQRGLARATGIAQPLIARVESGASSPRYDTLQRLLAGTGSALEVSRSVGQGVDRTLIRAALERSHEERIVAAGRAAGALDVFLSEVGAANRRR